MTRNCGFVAGSSSFGQELFDDLVSAVALTGNDQARKVEFQSGLDLSAVSPEHIQHRQLEALGRLRVIIPFEVVARRRQQAQPSPTALLRKREEARQRRLGDHHEVDALPNMIRGAVELVEQRRAGRARALLKLEARCRAAFEPRPGVLRETRKHEVVDHQGVLPGPEQLRQPYFGGTAVRSCPPEDVILRHEPSWRQMPPGFRHGLHRTAKLDLLFEEAVSRHSIAGRVAWKADADAHALTHPCCLTPSLRPGATLFHNKLRPIQIRGILWRLQKKSPRTDNELPGDLQKLRRKLQMISRRP